MLKKVLKLIKFIIVGILWSIVFFNLINFILEHFWNFNLLSAQSWKLINSYWEAGGIIRTWQDYLLLLIFILYIPLWILGWKKCYHMDYIQLLLKPFNLYSQKALENYEKDISKLKIKNMGTKIMKAEEELELKSKPKEPIKTDEEVNKIRQAVAEKINSVHYKG